MAAGLEDGLGDEDPDKKERRPTNVLNRAFLFLSDPGGLLCIGFICFCVYVCYSLAQSQQSSTGDSELANAEFLEAHSYFQKKGNNIRKLEETSFMAGVKPEEMWARMENQPDLDVVGKKRRSDVLSEFYRHHNPDKIHDVKRILKEWPIKQLINKLKQTYGESPDFGIKDAKDKKRSKKKGGYSTSGGCGNHMSCENCVKGGCGWCVQDSWCVRDQPGFCQGREDHIGHASGNMDCGGLKSEDEIMAEMAEEIEHRIGV